MQTTFTQNLKIQTKRENLLYVWIGLLVVGAGSMCASLLTAGYTIKAPMAAAVLALIAIAGEHESIKLTPGVEVSVSSLIFVFAAVVFGPLTGALVGAASQLGDLPRRDVDQPVLRWMAWTSIRFNVIAFAGLAAGAVGHARGDFWGLFGAVAAAFAVETSLDVVFAAVTRAIRGTSTFRGTALSVGPALVASVPLHAPVVAVLAYSYEMVSPWSVALFAIPAVAAQRLLLLYREQRETAGALQTANDRLERANLSFATALVATLDARDRYTAGHSAAVAIYARDIARRMGLSEKEQGLAHLCGLVHDIGKIGLPAGLLEKPGALALDERRLMEQHSEIGERILKKVDDYSVISSVVRHHHERVDGNGYPDRLEGDEIPLLARIIAVADAYNAMTSDRPYRDAMPSRVARLRLAQAVESQFDTAVVAAFEAILTTETEAYRTASGADFVLTSQNSVARPTVDLVDDLARLAAVAALA